MKNKNILVTGGTGSFGKKFVDLVLQNYSPKKIIVFSRDEMKQWEMAEKYKLDNRIKFIIGDVRDKDRLARAVDNVDYVVHAAATKIVPTAETNPFEAIKTNIIGAMNVIDVSIDKKIKKVVALSTDKASNPSNLYGATKLASDKLFLANNYNSKKNITKFSIVRYGNVIGSRGSVIPFFLSELKKKNKLSITDVRMTRFMITLDEAVKFVSHVIKDMKGGEIYVKKLPSMNIMDIAKAIDSKFKYKLIGIRPGEKLHEQMISHEDAENTYEYKDYYKIVEGYNLKKKKVKPSFFYSSNNNKKWMNSSSLKKILKKNKIL
tara:strand:+ start:609 stop:1568 length:960 start_codon:yes stop_codon:yes gene_type:complete